MFRKQKECSCDWSVVAGMQTTQIEGLSKSIQRMIALHSPTQDGRSCVECSRIICLGTPNKLGGIQYPCPTIETLRE